MTVERDSTSLRGARKSGWSPASSAQTPQWYSPSSSASRSVERSWVGRAQVRALGHGDPVGAGAGPALPGEGQLGGLAEVANHRGLGGEHEQILGDAGLAEERARVAEAAGAALGVARGRAPQVPPGRARDEEQVIARGLLGEDELAEVGIPGHLHRGGDCAGRRAPLEARHQPGAVEAVVDARLSQLRRGGQVAGRVQLAGGHRQELPGPERLLAAVEDHRALARQAGELHALLGAGDAELQRLVAALLDGDRRGHRAQEELRARRAGGGRVEEALDRPEGHRHRRHRPRRAVARQGAQLDLGGVDQAHPAAAVEVHPREAQGAGAQLVARAQLLAHQNVLEPAGPAVDLDRRLRGGAAGDGQVRQPHNARALGPGRPLARGEREGDEPDQPGSEADVHESGPFQALFGSGPVSR